ncbi:MAG: DNA ligase D [Nitrospira sp. BO4]|jgi:bifunctional non-homologous end joining protein LigD|nr:DNA ligase D [Nitrospira sp. BO4]
MSLTRYRKKRNFSQTPEPRGSQSREKPPSQLLYVVQKHAASRLHYDFRLELDGALKSWAVPKGPSLNPDDKRLAVHVEDHPMEYAAFEGIIPPKQYGAGTVMVWDQGQWESDGDPRAAYHKGRMKFALFGKKLQGRWTLVRMSGTDNADGKNWLLIKERDEYARTATRSNSSLASSHSVKSGRSMDEITKAKSDVWHSHRTSGGVERIKISRDLKTKRGSVTSMGTVTCPAWISPQLATLVDKIPEGEGWIHELKYDGYRMLCRIEQGVVQLFSRNGREWTQKLPEHVKAARRFSVENAWLDGELVAMKSDGSMSFQALQNAFDGGWDGRLVYYVFDLLFFNGRDLRSSPLHERKRLLASLLCGQPESGLLQYSAHILGKGPTVFETACRRGLEGVIAKRVDGRYTEGRNRNWVKVKCQRRQEFVIGGYTEPSGSRRGFGALLLGVYEKPGRLVYVGRVGTGFSENRLSQLYRILQRHERPRPPFVDPPTGGDTKGVHWVKPELVAEVRFAEWTQEGLLRQAAFLGLRDDKPAKAIVRESAVHASANREQKNRSADEPDRESKRAAARVHRARPLRQDRKPTHAAIVAGIEITNPYRVLFPHDGITKLELAQYYDRIGDTILPHVRGRPLTLVRCPEGHDTGCFYQKHATDQIHEAIDRVEVEESDGRASYMVANTTAALVALVQLGVLEFHTWGARRERLDRPDRMTLDLDPAPDVPWREVVEAAFLIRTLLEELRLTSFVKTTGGKGLHVVVPLQRRHSWDEVKDFAKSVAGHMVRTIPARFTDNMSKRVRKGKVYIDYLRNGRGATTVAAYSTRAKPRAPLSAPLGWDELTPSLRSDQFNVHNIEERLSELAKDPWAGYETVQQHLTTSMMTGLGTSRRL